MSQFILPPSPNWHQSNILACNDQGILAYGSKDDVSLINVNSAGKCDVSFINFAQKDKVNTVVFSPTNGSFKNCLATCGDDCIVKVWDFQEYRLLFCHSGHKDGVKVMGLDWSRVDTNLVISVNDLGSIVCWDLASNTIRRLMCGAKVLPLCLACSPHDKNLIAIGCKGGVTLVINIKGSGKVVQRLRGHEQDIISISWCPVPYNVIKYNRNEAEGGVVKKQQTDMLLATGGAEKSIFIWRISDGRYEVVLNLPHTAFNDRFPRKKGYMGTNTNVLWTCVHWVDAYTLLSSSQFGEVLSWDLKKVYSKDSRVNTKKLQPRMLHSCHHKGCFSIACPVIYDVVNDWKEDSRTVWSTAMDKHIVACSLSSGNVAFDISTMGGAVFCMALSPLDPNRLAIGSSDSKVFVWNMSDMGAFNITTYWKKIIGKVMSLSWHPENENWLAYGTSDGHVGLIDVNSAKLPTLFRLHLRKTVYRLSWALPILKSGDTVRDSQLVLYTVGDGDVLQFTANPLEPNEEPKSLNTALLNSFDQSLGLQKSLIRSDIVFKPDSSCFCIGSENGSVYIVSCKTLTLQHVVYPHKKLMNNLEWHPETVASDNNISLYKDWLATTCENIKVYNIPAEGQTELVATLSGHSEKIVGLAWSPHFNGRLVSASYDYTVQVWDVPSQSCLGVCLSHYMAVMCVHFSPQDPDIVISGSCDNTVRLWSTTQLTTTSVKPDKKKDRLGHVKNERATAQEATELIVGEASTHSTKSEKHNGSTCSTSPNTSQTTDKGTEDYKKRLKSRTVFKVTGTKLVEAKHFETYYQRWVASKTGTAVSPDDDTPSTSELGYLDFFGDDKAMQRLLMVEESCLRDSKQDLMAQHSKLWRGDVSEMIKEAITKKKLSDWLISIAPLSGYDVWEEACNAYANQLIECGEVLKASSYLLATHKVHEAVTLLVDNKMYREAVAMAKCRLSSDDQLISKVYTNWAESCRQQGSLALAAHCHLAANDTQACIETLARIKELKSLKMAVSLATQVGQTELASSLAVECLAMCVVASNHVVAHQLITEMPQYQYFNIWLKASELLAKVKNRNEVEVFDWLEGLRPGQVSLCEELPSVCDQSTYDKLLPYLPINKTPEFERDMWFYVSGQLAAAYAASIGSTPAHFLRHTVLALSAAYHYQTNHPSSLVSLLTLSAIAPHGLLSEKSILTKEYTNNEDKLLLKSLKAFVCASIIHWMTNNWEKVIGLTNKCEESAIEIGAGDTERETKLYKMSWLPKLLACCSAEVLDSESLLFFVKKAQKQELQNVVAKENIQNKKTENKTKQKSKDKIKTMIKKTGCEITCVVKAVSPDIDEEKCKDLDYNLNLTTENNTISVLDNETKQNSQDSSSKSKSQPLQKNQSKGLISDEKEDIHTCISGEKNVKAELENTNGFVINDTCKLVEPEGEKSTEKLIIKSECEVSVSEVNGSNGQTNGSSVDGQTKTNVKLKEIKELEKDLQKFEAERVSAPSPFTAYMDIKYLLDNLVSKQDSNLAKQLQENCDQLWNTSHQ